MKRETLMRRAADVQEKSINALAKKLEGLCLQRLLMLKPWWHERFPKRHLKIIWGNGAEAITVDGRLIDLNPSDLISPVQINMSKRVRGPRRTVRLPSSSLEPLALALRDICSMTNGYRLATPDDFEILSKERK